MGAEKKGKRKKLILKLIAILLGILVLFQISIYVFGEALFGEYIKLMVDNSTKGKYKIEYKKLQLNPVILGISFKNVRVKNIQNNENSTNLDELYINTLKLTGVKFLKLINDNKLIISSINIDNPIVTINKKNENADVNSKFVYQPKMIEQKILDVLGATLETINIDDINIKIDEFKKSIIINGKTPLWVQNSVEKIEINISDILIPPKVNNRFNNYFTSNISLIVDDIEYYQKDSIYKVTSKTINCNLTNGEIAITNFSLYKQNNNDYSPILTIPKYSLKIDNILEKFNDNRLNISNIEIDNPKIDIEITNNKNISVDDKKNEKIEQKALDFINKIGFKSLIINNLKTKNAEVKATQQGKNSNEYSIYNLYLNLENILIDSTTLESPDRIFFTKDIDINGKDLMVKLAEKKHTISSKTLDFNYKKKIIKLYNININPDDKNSKKTNFTIDNMDVDILGFNINRFYNRKDIIVESISIKSPNLSFFEEKSRSDFSRKKKNIKIDLSSYYKTLNIKKIKINNAKIEYINERYSRNTPFLFKASGNSIYLTVNNLTSYTAKKHNSYKSLFNFKAFIAKVSNYKMNLSDKIHILNIKQFELSTKTKNIIAVNASIMPKNIDKKSYKSKNKNKHFFEIAFPKVMLENVDINKAYKQKILEIGIIKSKKPIINLSSYFNIIKGRKNVKNKGIINPYPLIQNLLKSIYVGNVFIENGNFKIKNLNDNKFTLEQIGTTITANDFSINKNTQYDTNSIFYSKKVTGHINSYIINLPDNVHKLEIKKLAVNSDKKTIQAHSAKLYPATQRLDTIKTVKNFYKIYAPDIKFDGVNIKDVYNNHVFKAKNISLQSPDIQIIKNDNMLTKRIKKNWKDLEKKMPNRIVEIEISNFNISEGNVKALSLKENKKTPFLGTSAKLILKNVKLNNDILKKVDKMFYAKEFYLQMNNFSLDINKNQNVLTANQINIELSKKGGSFFATDFHLFTVDINKNSKSNIAKYNIFIPLLTLEEFNFDNAMIKNQYYMKTMSVVNPDIKLTQKKAINSSLHINKQLKNLLPKNIKISINKANIENIELNIYRNGKLKSHQKGININLKNFNLNKYSGTTSKILFSDDVKLLLPSAYIKTKDSLYVLKTNQIRVSTEKKMLKIDSLRIIPRYTHNKFVNKVGYQTDRMNIGLSEITCQGVNYKEYFNDNKMYINNVNINLYNIEIDRNKNFSQQENVQKPKSIHGMLTAIKTPFKVYNLNAKKGKIVYREVPKKGSFPHDAGKIILSDVNIEGKNIQNMASKKSKMNLNIQAKLQNKVELNATIVNNTNNDKMRITGTLKPTKLNIFNPVLKKLADISLSDGYSHHLSFDFNTNSNIANGTMFFTYDNLKISVNKDDGRRQGFTSFLANTFVIDSSNKKGTNYRKGVISFTRIPYRGPFNFIIKSIFTGVRSSIGLNSGSNKKKEK